MIYQPLHTSLTPRLAGLVWAIGSDTCAQDVIAKRGPKKLRPKHLGQRMSCPDALSRGMFLDGAVRLEVAWGGKLSAGVCRRADGLEDCDPNSPMERRKVRYD